MTICLIGKNGQLGKALDNIWMGDRNVVALGRKQLDLNDPYAIERVLMEIRPTVVINAAAYTDVDKAERERNAAFAVNAKAPAVIARVCAAIDADMIHISTDSVFDGAKMRPYVETDQTNPLNTYAESKLEGERAILDRCARAIVIRASWIYSSFSKSSFITKLASWSKGRAQISVVDDQISSPTSANDFATLIANTVQLLQATPGLLIEHGGLYHCPSPGYCSKYDWALAWRDEIGLRNALEISPAKTRDFPAPATRPSYSVLDGSKFTSDFGLSMPNWRVSLHEELRRSNII